MVVQIAHTQAAAGFELVFLVLDGLIGTGDNTAHQGGIASHLELEFLATLNIAGFAQVLLLFSNNYAAY